VATKDPQSWAYHDDFAQLIASMDHEVALRVLEAADIALTFARALVAKEYDRANAMLSAALKCTHPPSVLQKCLEEMIQYSESTTEWPTGVQVVTGADSGDDPSPRKTPEDFGWMYVAIVGDGYCEAVTVTIANEDNRLIIREIEWGRP
jgi:hypothetical protein